MPPSEPPVDERESGRSPSASSSRHCARAWSRVVTCGKVAAVRPDPSPGRSSPGRWCRSGRRAGWRTARRSVPCRAPGPRRSAAPTSRRPRRPSRSGRGRRGPAAPSAGARPSCRYATVSSGRTVPSSSSNGPSVGDLEPAGPRRETGRPRRAGFDRHPAAPTSAPSFGRFGGRRLEGLGQVGDEVVDVLEADRQPDEVRRDAGLDLLLGLELRVRGRCRMDDQRLRVADVREQARRSGRCR